MVLKTDQERIKALLKDTITLLCRNGLTFKTEFSIEALIGITLDQDDVLLVNINEIVRTELGNKLAAAAQESGQSANIGGDDWDDNYSDEGSQNSPSHSSSGRKRKRKRRRSKGSKAENESDGESGDSITGADDANSLSEPPMKRSLPAATSRVKNSVKQEHEDEDDDGSKDIVFIKEEVDSGDWANASSSQGQDGFASDLSGIPSNSSMNQQQENFDFLQGNSLIPMSGSAQQNASLWSDMTGRQNITSPASKRTSTVTTTGAPGMGDESQQTYGRTIYSLASEQGSVEVKDGAVGQTKVFVCNICSRTLTTKRGFEAHMGQHLGIYRYKCGTCGKGFPSTTALRDHERGHTGQKLSCPLCFKQFTSSMGLKHHMKSIHSFQTQGMFKANHGAFPPILGLTGNSPDGNLDRNDIPKTPESSVNQGNDSTHQFDDTLDKIKAESNMSRASSRSSETPQLGRDTNNPDQLGDLGKANIDRFEMMFRGQSGSIDALMRAAGNREQNRFDGSQREPPVADADALSRGPGNNETNQFQSMFRGPVRSQDAPDSGQEDDRNDNRHHMGNLSDMPLLPGFNFK